MSVACYTAVMGGYDDLPSHPDIPGVEFVAFTDRAIETDQWNVRVVVPGHGHPRDAAKLYKVFPHRYLPEHEYTIWIDGSHEILTADFAAHCLAGVGDSGMAVYEHPWRDCIYPEAEASLQLPKYQGLPIQEQVDSYRADGHPEKWGLFATGTIARRNISGVQALMDAWAHELDRWTYQDQLSLPVVCRRLGVRPDTFPCHQVFGNQWTRIHPHHRED